jgi:hypothetical protein
MEASAGRKEAEREAGKGVLMIKSFAEKPYHKYWC